ncbi:NACHT, LRR and PYD domains-containing protein 12-like [Echeneis naucrates]|uniref:NACHT, LRR and PYD domains-containing protein 12-like n=1 Tax=Echeneis naucrates TaxID=173247 RepID=A0A665VC77_ECHNA|nr:NACHT, LRR and PYD domains-containing protein 12-like [Echeneis naucrates]
MARAVSQILLDTFEELVDEELKTFQFRLYNHDLEGLPHIPRSHVHGVDRLTTVGCLVQTYCYDGAVTVTVDILRKMNLILLADTLKKKYDKVQSNQKQAIETTEKKSGSDQEAIRDRLKSTLRKKYQNVYQGNAEEGDNVYLNKIFTELHVIEGAWGGFSDEPETTEETSIKANNIFKPKPNQEKQIRTVLTLGIPGVGKTVCAQKFTLSWAEGEENQDITFLFPLPFRELNPNIGEKECSLIQLLHQFFPEMKTLETLGSECKVLFIFDGLDETLLPLNFRHNKVLRDETEPASLDVLITNLITGDLLGNALVWITSRPAAADRIHRRHIDLWTEVKGFTNEQKEEYFKRCSCDSQLAVRIINNVKSSRSLNIMCKIPVFCWIILTVMRKMLHDNVTSEMPNTLTEMYVHLLLCQADKMIERHYPMENDNVVLKLAELAYRQLEKGKLIFYEADLKECGINIEEATIYSGVCTVFVKEGRRRQEVFSFVHLTIQEFLAALHVHYSYVNKTSWFRKSLFNLHKRSIEKALKSNDGHWDIFLRFLLGLSLKSNQELLSRILHLQIECEDDVAKTVQFIKDKIKQEPEPNLNLFHCLSELNEESMVQEIQNFVSSGGLTAKNLTPAQWSALTFQLITSEATEKEFDLKRYMRSEEGLKKLLTVITSSSRALLNHCNLTEKCCEDLASGLSSASCHMAELDLSENSLKDSGVKLLCVGLGSPHCKLRSLSLQKCKLKGGCFEALGVALSTESNRLTELDLSSNDFWKAGVKDLCVGLRSHHCKLQILRLNQCRLKDSSCEDLASVMSSGTSHLKNLDLSNNNMNDSGLYMLTAGLRSPHCRLETLGLSCCGLTQKSYEHIGATLSVDSTHLKGLDLSGNSLHGPGIQLLCAGLRSPHCKLKILRLNDANLQKCCADLASVLSSDTSHLEALDLSGNDLQDAEVALLSAGLESPHCKLEILRLSFCGITKEGCTYLASALSSNPSCVRQLDLSYNFLQISGVNLISCHQDNPLCALEILSVEKNAECYLRSMLKKYASMLRFNENTAAKSLFLHDGGKQVTWVRERQQYPDHPDRFECVSQVLCLQALTQRHYWEVEWRGHWVDVAVAMRGISRRASYHLSGFGKTDKSWSLYCSEDHYSVHHDGDVEEITAPLCRSHRVGVYLDWPSGTLSFYSVSSRTLSHLYTFHCTFTEPLYAGFGMEEDDCSVIICTEQETPQLISDSADAGTESCC